MWVTPADILVLAIDVQSSSYCYSLILQSEISDYISACTGEQDKHALTSRDHLQESSYLLLLWDIYCTEFRVYFFPKRIALADFDQS
jgi:hypothetical protein